MDTQTSKLMNMTNDVVDPCSYYIYNTDNDNVKQVYSNYYKNPENNQKKKVYFNKNEKKVNTIENTSINYCSSHG